MKADPNCKICGGIGYFKFGDDGITNFDGNMDGFFTCECVNKEK